MVTIHDDKEYSSESKESKNCANDSQKCQEGVVKQIQAQLFEQTHHKYKKQEDADKDARDQAYVKAQVEKIESALKSAPIPIPSTPPVAQSRSKRMGWGSSSSPLSSWQSPVLSLSNVLGFGGSQSPKALSRQNSLASISRASMRAAMSSSESKDKSKTSGDGVLSSRLPEESSVISSEERKEESRMISPRRHSKSPTAHAASRYLRTSLQPMRAKSPMRATSPNMVTPRSSSNPSSRNPTPTTPNRSLLARVASPFAGRPTSAPSPRNADSESDIAGTSADVAISAFPKSKLTVKRMSSSMIQRSK